MTNKIFPKPLKKGDKIAIISPAGSVEESQLTSTLQLIRSQSYEPIFGKNTLELYRNGYNYAGTESQRIKDLNWALNDETISAVWATRGGYGCQHLLKHIKLTGFNKKPKWYIGYSDNTAIQSFLLKKGFTSVHGQTIKTSSFGVTDESYQLIFDVLSGKKLKYSLEANDINRKGKAEGELVGGNLALIYALLGTKYSFNFKDNILFIEDIGENFYALDRMLMSLDLAGVFSSIKGLIVGGMTNIGNEKENVMYEEPFDDFAYHIIQERVKKYNFPVLYAFSNGHIRDNRPLVIGSKIKLNITKTLSEVIFQK